MGQAHDHTRFAAVELIPFANDITQAVKAFAAARVLTGECYYHDLPVWMLHDPEPLDGRIRSVQIVAYLVGREAFLSLVPAVELFLSETKMLVPRQCPANCFPTSQVLNGEQEFDRSKFTDLLTETWEQTATLELPPEEMIEVAVSEVT